MLLDNWWMAEIEAERYSLAKKRFAAVGVVVSRSFFFSSIITGYQFIGGFCEQELLPPPLLYKRAEVYHLTDDASGILTITTVDTL